MANWMQDITAFLSLDKAEREKWEKYQKAGGTLSLDAWERRGKPTTLQPFEMPLPSTSKPSTTGIPTKGTPAERIAAGLEAKKKPEQTMEERLTEMMRQAEEKSQARGQARWDIPIPGGAKEGEVTEGIAGDKGIWYRDPETGYPFWSSMTEPPEQKKELPTGYFASYGEANTAAPEGYVPIQTPDGWRLERQDPTTQPGYISPYQQETLKQQRQSASAEQAYNQDYLNYLQQTQEAQAAAQKEAQLASLRANPASWLEYASLAGETPVVQPWMLPLSPQDYGWTAGQTGLPGYSPTGKDMNLMELTKPSSQLWSRMAPSARGQYTGYETARTGQTAEDVNWRQWQGAAPSGSFSGLTRLR